MRLTGKLAGELTLGWPVRDELWTHRLSELQHPRDGARVARVHDPLPGSPAARGHGGDAGVRHVYGKRGSLACTQTCSRESLLTTDASN